MSILLKEVYEETKNKYGLRLIAGEGGLSAIMSWVYISESIVGSEFLGGSELIITTGIMCRESPEWLYHFIEAMINEHPCPFMSCFRLLSHCPASKRERTKQTSLSGKISIRRSTQFYR